MSYLEYSVKTVPNGWRKILFVHWPLVLLITAVACVGFMMLFSVSGGVFERWAEPQIQRFIMGFVLMFGIAMVPIWFWRNVSLVGYLVALALLVGVEFVGSERGGAQRWIDLGFMRLQPSELMKITLVMFLAAYYDWLPVKKTSHPLWVLAPVVIVVIPVFLVLNQPDLGTAILLLTAGGLMMFLAGVHWLYFVGVVASVAGAIFAIFQSRGTTWQLIQDYQFQRIDVFLNPTADARGDAYQIIQGQIAMGSGGWTGKGFMQGTQTRLNFLPEKHTDFIFNTLAEEFGFVGSMSLLVMYALIVFFCIASALQNRDRFASLLTLGIGMTFFLFFAVNMAMVMGLAPVVGVPLPLVSYGGSAMLILMIGFGLVQSAHIHRPR